MTLRFAITGTAGFIAPRHLAAIEAVGGELMAALDPHDSVGRLDAYNVDCESFQDEEAFWEHLSRHPVDYVSICSPNDQHYRQTRRALGVGAHAICEKPLVLDPRELDAYEHLERDGARVWPILQLRLNKQLKGLRHKLDDGKFRTVYARYITRRGKWYHRSWKGDDSRSGTILTNLGVHVFDVLTWLWGEPVMTGMSVPGPHELEQDYAEGEFEFTRAKVDWRISCRPGDLDAYPKRRHAHAHRSLLISDGRLEPLEIDLSDGFEVNHLEVYERIIAGDWIGYKDVRPGIQLVHDMLAAPRIITRHAV